MKSFFRRFSAVLLTLALLVTTASALSVDQALELLDENYLRDIPAQARQAETLDQLFSLLGDPYTYYMTAEEYQQFLDQVEGTQELVGIGVAVQFTDEGILITQVLSGGSAQAAGLAADDLIVAIDGVSCVPAQESHRDLLIGTAGTFVTITVLRDGVTRTYSLMRQQIVIPNTEASLADGHIGYIECTSFGSDSGTLIADSIRRYDSQADCWVLDLRFNLGGYTDAAVSSLGAFAGAGVYLFLRDKEGSIYYYSYSDSACTQDPVIVLVNGSSASASEALAAGVRDSGRGIIVGARTYGKGVAQIVLDQSTHPDLFDGDGLKVTSYRFYSQKGSTTDQIGVIPTLLVSDLYAPSVAKALCASMGGDLVTDGLIMLSVGGQYFFLDPETTSPAAASALLSALPPSARLWVGGDTYYWYELTTDEAAELLGATYTSRYFFDVDGSPYADEINTLASYYLLLGDGAGKFFPQSQLTRAEVCAMLAQLLDLSYSGSSHFTDVADSAWYADEVNAMAALGLVEGVGGSRFLPDAVLSQQEFFTILGRMARYLNFNVDNYSYLFYDENGDCLLDLYPELDGFANWAKESTALLAWSSEALGKTGSMLFDDLSELDPTAPIRRDEAAACLYRVLSLTGILTV